MLFVKKPDNIVQHFSEYRKVNTPRFLSIYYKIQATSNRQAIINTHGITQLLELAHNEHVEFLFLKNKTQKSLKIEPQNTLLYKI